MIEPLSDRQFCENMLPKVSRTFAACINLLPKTLAYEVLISYLLCRIADTIEDHPSLPGPEKRVLLESFKHTLYDASDSCDDVRALFSAQQDGPVDDCQLTAECHRVLREFHGLSASAKAAIGAAAG